MNNQKQTIRKIVRFLNNPEEEGGFWLPNIQRPFVWSENQIYKLFDSILRQYPISTLLVWKTKSKIRRRKFIGNWKDTLHLSDFYVPEDDKKKILILDGQQRLQSLFIGLCGSYEGKELFFNILSGNVAAPDDIKYHFKFLNSSSATFPWVKFKDLVFTSKIRSEQIENITSSAGRGLAIEELKKVGDHVDLVNLTFKINEALTYQELDSIDDSSLYTEDDVVEIFIRANSGGTKLGKSDLLFSLLGASWEIADQKMEELLDSLNKHGFDFDRDFVLKTSLTLLGQGARYEVKKFRENGVREQVQEKWDEISNAIKDVLDFVREKTFIQCDKAMPTYLVLIPLIYLRYHYLDAWKAKKDVDEYLLRCSLTGAFSGQSDSLIDALVKEINKQKSFDKNALFGVIRDQNRSLELTEDRLWQMGYGSNTIHLLFNLWYIFNYTPANPNNLPEVDHIFPQSVLRKVKTNNPSTGRQDLMKYSDKERNQFANCMLLTKKENSAGGKSDMLPKDWFEKRVAEEGPKYLDEHSIPTDKSLWEIDRFEDFIEARKQLIRDKFNWLLIHN